MSKVCLVDSCKKKAFINGYCREHVHLGRKVIKPVWKTITEEDLQRRSQREAEKLSFDLNIQSIRDQIETIKNDRTHSDSRADFLLRELEEEIRSSIEKRNRQLDYEINRTKSQYQEKYNSTHKDKYRRYMDDKAGKGNKSDKQTNSDSDDSADAKNGRKSKGTANKLVIEAFELLDIQQTKDLQLIKSAYKKKALLLHPDKHPQEAEEYTAKFKELGSAYEFLCLLLDNSW